MRTFNSGATRDSDEGKLHIKDHFSPAVLCRYSEYMRTHETEASGNKRDPGNWKKGIPRDAYMDSLLRHVVDLWKKYDADGTVDQDLACAGLFNLMGILHEVLLGRDTGKDDALQLAPPNHGPKPWPTPKYPVFGQIQQERDAFGDWKGKVEAWREMVAKLDKQLSDLEKDITLERQV